MEAFEHKTARNGLRPSTSTSSEEWALARLQSSSNAKERHSRDKVPNDPIAWVPFLLRELSALRIRTDMGVRPEERILDLETRSHNEVPNGLQPKEAFHERASLLRLQVWQRTKLAVQQAGVPTQFVAVVRDFPDARAASDTPAGCRLRKSRSAGSWQRRQLAARVQGKGRRRMSHPWAAGTGIIFLTSEFADMRLLLDVQAWAKLGPWYTDLFGESEKQVSGNPRVVPSAPSFREEMGSSRRPSKKGSSRQGRS